MNILPLRPEDSVFCSFAFTGQEREAVEHRMRLVTETFRAVGMFSVYCNLEDESIKAI